MGFTVRALAVLLVATSAAQANPQADSQDSVDAKLSDSAGKEIQISQFRGKPTLLIYEDRGSREVNRKVKDELWKRGRESGLQDAANVVGVANLQAFDFWPARSFARSAVRDVEKKAGIKVLIDWKGTLTTNPWNLPSKSSTVVLLDANGTVRYSHSGAMDEKELTAFFDTFAQLIETERKAAPTK